MGRSTSPSMNTLWFFLLTFQSALAVPATPITSLNPPLSLSQPNLTVPALASLPPGGKWFSVSKDGSQTQRVNGPDDKPASSPSVGDWQYWHFYILDYPSAASPNITDALFDCEYQLFSIVPPFGTGVQTPLPRGRYTCDPRSEWVSDGLEMRFVENKVDFKLTIQDTAFAISSVGRMVREMNLTTSFLFTQYYLPDGVVVEGFYNISGISTVATS